MKYSYLVFFLFLLISCKNFEQPQRVITTIELNAIEIDSASVRALEKSGDAYWFAGNRGSYGRLSIEDHQIDEGTIVYEGNEQLEFRSIAVTNEFTYILTAGNPALIYKISHTTDSLSLIYKEEGDAVFYDSMKFWNDQEGIAMGDPQGGCFTILLTQNAGESWQKIPCDRLPKMVTGEAAYAASNSNIALQGDHIWIATGGKAARVWHSANRGKTWEIQETPIISGGAMTGIYAIDFYDEKLGFIIGGDWDEKSNSNYNKAITYDGGKTWELIANGSGPGYCSDVAFVPQTNGNELVAVGSPGIWWSGNRGKEWTQLSSTGFYTVAFKNDLEGLVAGSNRMSSFKLKENELID